MSTDGDKRERKTAYEPPRLMRLAAPNAGAAFCQEGSNNQAFCESVGSTANSCGPGVEAEGTCESGGGGIAG
jgi:hypothetical protein